MDSLDAPKLQHTFLALLGDHVRAKIAKEATTILKGVTKDSSPPPGYGRAMRSDRRLTPAVLVSFSVSQFRTLLGARVNEGVGPLFASLLSLLLF